MSDASDVFGIVGGTVGVGTLIVGIVKWGAGRLVQREDEDKKALQLRQEESAKTERNIERTLIGLQHDVQGLRTDFANSAKQFESRAMQQDKEIAEVRSEFKEELRQVEHRIKGEMQRMIIASMPPKKARG